MVDKLKKFYSNTKNSLLIRRVWLRGSYLEYILVFVAFVVLTIVYTNFVAFHMTTQLFAGTGDATAGFLWLNFVDPGLSPFLDPTNYVNYPYGETLGGPTFVTYFVLWLPLRVLSFFFGPIAGLNLVMFWGYISAALSMYWLVKRLTGMISVALFAGFATAFVPYAIYQSSGHLAYIFSYVFVLIIAGFIAVMVRPTKIRAILLSIAIALAFYTDGYYVLLASVLVGALCLAGVVYSLLVKMHITDFWRRFKALLLSAGCLLVLLAPIGFVQLTQGAQVSKTLSSARSDIRGELREYKSELVDFLVPAMSDPFFDKDSTFLDIHNIRNQHSNTGESTTYIGYVLLLLTTIGGVILAMWFLLRKHSSLKNMNNDQRKMMILTGSVILCAAPILLSFMFSPDIHIFGHRIPLPGALLAHYNIALWRVMARFFIPLHVVIVLFASVSLGMIIKLSSIRKLKMPWRHMLTWFIVGIFGVILAFEYATTIYHPVYDFSKVQKGYLWLKKQPDIKVVAELPIVDPLDHHTSDYITAQIVHNKKLVNFKEPSDMRLTDTLGTETNPETIDWAYSRGAQAVITHGETCRRNVDWGSLIFSDDDNLTNAMCIYKLIRPETNDTAFIRYGNGFAYSPNEPDPSVTVFRTGTATLYITDNSFAISPKNIVARFTANLTGSTSKLVQGRWNVIQNGKVIGSGNIQGEKTKIDVTVSRKYPVTIRIDPIDKRVIGLGEFILTDVKATNLQ